MATFTRHGLFLVIFYHISSVVGDKAPKLNVTKTEFVLGETPVVLLFTPGEIEKLVMGERDLVSVAPEVQPALDRLNTGATGEDRVISLKVEPADKAIAKVTEGALISLPLTADTNDTSFVVEGLFLGRTHLEVYAKAADEIHVTYKHEGAEGEGDLSDPFAPPDRNFTGAVNTQRNLYIPTTDQHNLIDEWQKLDVKYKVAVIRADRALDRIFLIVIIVLLVFANVGMGCKIDLEVVKEVLKRPVAPTIGFCCQFIVMPLLAFSLVLLLRLETGVALGFFAMGCAPGGGASNIYTYLLNGDLSLSITMTTISTFASLGMIPLWLFTLGQHLLNEQDYDVKIPYTNIVTSLAGIILPIAVGIIIQYKKPTWAKKIIKTLRPIYLIFIIFMFTFGIYVNLYIFRLFTPFLVLAGCLLPWVGFALGGLVAFLLRQPMDRIKTIAIETGIQNSGIPIVLMKFSLPQPEADMSLVSPIVVSVFTPVPLIALIVFLEIRKRFCAPKKEFNPITDEDEHHVDPARAQSEANANSIYRPNRGSSVENGQPTFERELKPINSSEQNV